MRGHGQGLDRGRAQRARCRGNGPINAIDQALRAALLPHHPVLAGIHLTDYKVRILDGATATGAITRVLLDATDGERTWTTIGVSSNIIEASWQALSDSIVYGLLVEELREAGGDTAAE
ncbi:MAG: alpha-isopropylmalate synthase regulatory domain-containing protein [Ilumatobacteraceae bacterium]